MKIVYFLDEDKIFEIEDSFVPCRGDLVFLQEIFYVDTVVWYPESATVRINLKDENKSMVKVAESNNSTLKLRQQITEIAKKADRALDQTSDLKRQIFSVRQHIKGNFKNDET